ncbi:hypothetical protein [Burkholderia phage FLC9]|nr:hypothetical protein [Burkholderia phage FLC9]
MALFSGTPTDRLIALVNQANPHLPYPASKSNLYFGGARLAASSTDNMSSVVPVVGQLGSVYEGYRDFTYKRINLSTAYDQIPVMSSVGASTLYGMLDIVNAFLGLNLTQQDVVDTNVAYLEDGASVNINIQTLPTSRGYTGSMLLQFNRIRPFLTAVIRNVRLNVQTFNNVDPTIGKQDIGMVMWNVDMGPFLASLGVNSNGTWKNAAAVKAAMVQQFNYTDWPTAAAGTVTDYATAKYPGANTNFQRVVVQTKVVGSTYVGTALFHYNPT